MEDLPKKHIINEAFLSGRIEGKYGDGGGGFILDKYNPDGEDFPNIWDASPRPSRNEDFNPMVLQQLLPFPRILIAQLLGEEMLADNKQPEQPAELTAQQVKTVSEIVRRINHVLIFEGSTDDEITRLLEKNRGRLNVLLAEFPSQLDATIVDEWEEKIRPF